jgi:hypothetical protein
MQGKQTGAKSELGRFIASHRGLKHGFRSAGGFAFKRWLVSVNKLIKALQ